MKRILNYLYNLGPRRKNAEADVNAAVQAISAELLRETKDKEKYIVAEVISETVMRQHSISIATGFVVAHKVAADSMQLLGEALREKYPHEISPTLLHAKSAGSLKLLADNFYNHLNVEDRKIVDQLVGAFDTEAGQSKGWRH